MPGRASPAPSKKQAVRAAAASGQYPPVERHALDERPHGLAGGQAQAGNGVAGDARAQVLRGRAGQVQQHFGVGAVGLGVDAQHARL